MARVAIAVAVFALTVFALADCIQTAPRRIRAMPKPAWLLVIVLVAVIGPASWLLFGRPTRRPPPRQRPPLGPRGPEDDPDFLRTL